MTAVGSEGPGCGALPVLCGLAGQAEGKAPRARLRIRSVPGGFLILGVLMVLAGGAVALVDYWPQSSPGAGGRGLVPGRGHSERKVGPIVIGVGLFIFICANTLLYENRDRESQALGLQCAAIHSMVITLAPPLLLPGTQSPGPAPHAPADPNIRCPGEGAGPQWEGPEAVTLQIGGGATLLTKALHHQQSSSHSSSLQSGSCNSSQVNFNVLPGSPQPGPRRPSPPLIKLNNCPLQPSPPASPTPPRRSHSLSGRAGPWSPAPRADPQLLRQDFCSSLGDRKHRSWPRLDRGGGRRYLKLENKEDSVDRLLEQHDSQWGSGPFQ